MEEHLRECPACAHAYQGCKALRSAITPDLYLIAPPSLRRRIEASIPPANRPLRPHPALSWRWLAVAAVLAIVVGGLIWTVLRFSLTSTPNQVLGQEVVASHIRSLMETHLTDIPSSDQHTVKPWFNGKLDFSPPVQDFASQGFPLIGGRLDYLDNRPVAALIYRHRQHPINLFIWPAENQPDRSPSSMTLQGYHLIHWRHAGMNFWAISDVNADALRQFVYLLRPSPTSAPSP
jgi:anti-sigma factor RsiW